MVYLGGILIVGYIYGLYEIGYFIFVRKKLLILFEMFFYKIVELDNGYLIVMYLKEVNNKLNVIFLYVYSLKKIGKKEF